MTTLNAPFIDTAFKRSPELSHTARLIARSRRVFENAGNSTRVIRAVDHDIAQACTPMCASTGGTRTLDPSLSR